MKFWTLFMQFHLVQTLKFTAAGRTHVHHCLHFHFFLPLPSQKFSLSSLTLFLVQLLRGRHMFLHLLFSLLFQLFHGDGRTSFFKLNLPLSLPVVVVIFLLGPFPDLPFSFFSFIRQRLVVVIIGFISWVHDSHLLPCYLEPWLVGFSICDGGLFGREEFQKSKIFESASHFISNLSNILDRN